jgi:hypothetical protein
MMPRRGFATFVLMFILAFNPVLAYGQLYYTPSELSITVYADGYVAVDYFVDVDPTRPRVNVTLFGSLYIDILVEDQDGLLLGYSPSVGGLSIDTLGSISVLTSYFTQDLTSKSGQIWTLAVAAPVDASIILPEGSTIVSFSSLPLSMSNLGENLLLTMPAGEIEVSYKIGVAGTRERAVAVINDAEATIDVIKDEGIIVDEAETLLRQAQEALDGELYAEAEQLAEDAKDSALEAQAQADSALQQAEDAYEAGDYAGAEGLADDARTAATEATKKGGLPVIWIGAGALLVALAAGAFFLNRRGGEKRVVDAPVRFDLDRLFEEHSHLRLDDKEVLRFLSLWRMIRRLEKEEVVDVSTIGGQSLVKISQNYRAGGSQA